MIASVAPWTSFARAFTRWLATARFLYRYAASSTGVEIILAFLESYPATNGSRLCLQQGRLRQVSWDVRAFLCPQFRELVLDGGRDYVRAVAVFWNRGWMAQQPVGVVISPRQRLRRLLVRVSLARYVHRAQCGQGLSHTCGKTQAFCRAGPARLLGLPPAAKVVALAHRVWEFFQHSLVTSPSAFLRSVGVVSVEQQAKGRVAPEC